MSCEDDMPPLVAPKAEPTCAEDSDFDSDDEEEMPEQEEPTTCLFCPQIHPTVDAAIVHLDTTHGVNFAVLKTKFQMDQYSFLKLINCVRADGVQAEKLAQTEEVFWNDEKYLRPKDYEPWLCYDYDELPSSTGSKSASAADVVTTTELEVRSLQQKLKEQTLLLQQATEDMAKMRETFQRLLEKDDLKTENGMLPGNCVAATPLRNDEGYFGSYSHYGIHHEMLSDIVRTRTYRDALLQNRAFMQGKDVLDVGCGTAILSIFAAQAGARKVVGIDNSDIVYDAMDIVKNNNVENIVLVKGRLEDTELPQQKYDVIISEWMGYFLLYEGMLDSIIYARDHHLKEGGLLMPNRCTMSLVGYGNEELFGRHVTFWNDVYGLNMANMRNEMMHEPLVEIVDPAFILTEPNIIAELDVATVDLDYSNFGYDFKLRCTKPGQLSAFVSYFDIFFDLPERFSFGTGPKETPTHWKQVVFFLEQPKTLKLDDIISGRIECRRSVESARWLEITIEAYGKKAKYHLH